MKRWLGFMGSIAVDRSTNTLKHFGTPDEDSRLWVSTEGGIEFCLVLRMVAFPTRDTDELSQYMVVDEEFLPHELKRWYEDEKNRLSAVERLKLDRDATEWTILCSNDWLYYQTLSLTVLDPAFASLDFHMLSIKSLEPITLEGARRRQADRLKIEAIRRLHTPGGHKRLGGLPGRRPSATLRPFLLGKVRICRHDHEVYPCATIRALDGS